jgi:hypothetical protein
MRRKRMSYQQYVRANIELVILAIAAGVSITTSWWIFAAVFVSLWIRNAIFPLKPEEYDDGK